MTHASRRHALMDVACAEALARDGVHTCEQPGGALLPSRLRNQDLRTMHTTSNKRVLLATLSARKRDGRVLEAWRAVDRAWRGAHGQVQAAE